MYSGLGRLAPLELPRFDDSLPDLADEQARGWNFPDTRSAVVAFIDVMTAALEAVLIQQELRRLQGELGAARLWPGV